MGAISDINSRSRLLFLFSLVLVIIYVPGIIGATIPTGWLYLIALMPLLLQYCKIELDAYILFGLLFIIYTLISFFWTTNLNIGFFSLLQLAALACIFVLGQNLISLSAIFKGLAIGIGISNLLLIIQYYFKFDWVFYSTGTAAGLFVNSNIASEVSVVILIALIILNLWKWMPLTLPSLVLVPSRAALLSLGICLFIWLFKKNRLYFIIFLISGIGIGYLYYHFNGFKLTSIQERFNLWADTYQGFKLFGNGIGSFEITYPWDATHIDTIIARPRFAHNDLLQLIFEFGIGSLFILFMIFNILKINRPERIILYAIGIISLFSFPLHVPVLAFIAALVAGNITRYDTTRLVRNYSGSILSTRT